jgi:uncharacterized protein (UPF0216 family)
MATQSIKKNIVIRDKNHVKALIKALEKSQNTDKKHTVSKAVLYNPSVDQLQKIFSACIVLLISCIRTFTSIRITHAC